MKRIFLLLFLSGSLNFARSDNDAATTAYVPRSGSTGCTPYAPTPDERLSLCSLSVNARVLSVQELASKGDRSWRCYEAEMKVLKIHKGTAPPTIRMIFQVANGYDDKPVPTVSCPIPQIGERYTLFLLPVDEKQAIYTTSIWTVTPLGMNLLPLQNDQPDDARPLPGEAVDAIAKTELCKHRPELKDVHIRKGFWGLHWTVTLSNIKTPQLPEAQIVIDTAGQVSNTTWIAAGPVRKAEELPEEDSGVPLVLLQKSVIAEISRHPSLSELPIRITWGRIAAVDHQWLHGEFHCLTTPPTYDDRFPMEELYGFQRLAVVPTVPHPRPGPIGIMSFSSVLTPDDMTFHAPVIVNGRVTAIAPFNSPLPEPYQKSRLEGDAVWVNVEVLATLKGDAPKRLRLPYLAQKESVLEKGKRYSFLLERHGDQFLTAKPHAPRYTTFLLSDDQPDDALLLVRYDIARLAQTEYARHHPEPHYIEILTLRESNGWHVTFPTYHSQFGTPMDCAAELFFTKDGKIIDGWVAAEPPRAEARQDDIGKFLRFTLREPSEGAPPPYRRSFFGVLKSASDDTLTGTFFSLAGEPPLQRIAKQDLTGVQQLALAPSPPADSPH